MYLQLLKRSSVFLIAFALSGFYPGIQAQETTAQIRGTVTDATGSAIPQATVKATDTQTGVEQTIPSEANGTFQFLHLSVGKYDILVSKAGFESFSLKGITLILNQEYEVNARLAVGSLNQTVQVEANAAQVETTTTQLGNVIEAQKIVDLPLNGRNWTSLQTLNPGVVASSDRFASNFATNGSQSQQNSFLINGADSIDLPLNTPAVIPSPDAIGEFNLITSTINPEYGRNSGGILNAIIKSGTNAFHGDAFEFYRDTFLDGRNLFQKTKPVYHQNQFGGTLGGPLWKDHTFFFISYQGTRARSPQSASQTPVFSADQRSGLFSDLSRVLPGVRLSLWWAATVPHTQQALPTAPSFRLGRYPPPTLTPSVKSCSPLFQRRTPQVVFIRSTPSLPARLTRVLPASITPSARKIRPGSA
ncbi:MAG: carboxypeptidase-like regulatory domain-containing protein [Acidobacteriota bacterium]|nr:carboxypeptidase-like regulatory domain-containing protein [Acidobacteriota bacterium]